MIFIPCLLKTPGKKKEAVIAVSLFFLLCLFFSCAGGGGRRQGSYRVAGTWYHPLKEAGGFVQEGIASWYGKPFHGRRTASGEIYNMYQMTAAHKTLPLGTYVRVTRKDNNKSVVVRINDRGPFVRGRIIDLSYEAARRLSMIGTGTARVVIEVCDPPVKPPAGYAVVKEKGFCVQVGSFSRRDRARRLASRLSARFADVRIVEYDTGTGLLFRVRVGRFSNRKDAEALESRLVSMGFHDAFAVAIDK